MDEKKPVKRVAKAAAKPKETKAELKLPAAALILSYRRGSKTQRNNQMLIEVEGADTKPKASMYIGKNMVWKTPSGREMRGKITSAHGNKGVLRVRFVKGLPGHALGKKAKVV